MSIMRCVGRQRSSAKARCVAYTVAAILLTITAGFAAIGEASTYTQLYEFSGCPDGASPLGKLLVAKDDTLYGTTEQGGSTCSFSTGSGNGSVFSLTPPSSPGGSWTESVLYAFGLSNDVIFPVSELVTRANGVLYGTGLSTTSVNLGGGVFSLTPPVTSGGSWTESILHTFKSGTDGFRPAGDLTLSSGGVLFGMTTAGGTGSTGTAFGLRTSGGYKVLYNFQGFPNGDGIFGGLLPTAGGFFDSDSDNGDLSLHGGGGCGYVFMLGAPTTPGGSWTATPLHTFEDNPDGCHPAGDLARDRNGILYGATTNGGTLNDGTIFSLTPPAAAGGAWTEAILYTFTGGADSGNPVGSLVIGPGGVLYGETAASLSTSVGTVFSLTPPAVAGGAWTQNVLHTFTGEPDGAFPSGGLVASHGVLYGVASAGGVDNQFFCFGGCGTVFSVVP